MDTLTYIWTAVKGTLTDSGHVVFWTAPNENGYYYINCRVEDNHGNYTTDSIGITVGNLIAFYSFSGSADDESGFGNHGSVYGPVLTNDRFGSPNSAYLFDGIDDNIRVTNNDILNVEEEITINCWINIGDLYSREIFIISHGSWQNRWKISIIPGGKLRWTIKTDAASNSGIADLDSHESLTADSLYNITCMYGTGEMKIYLNGILSSSRSWTGKLLKTDLDLTIGQMLPGNTEYNYSGIIDDIRIYNNLLSESEIIDLYDLSTSIAEEKEEFIPKQTRLHPNYPNPFNMNTTIRYDLNTNSHVSIKIFNILGQEVHTLFNGKQSPGEKRISWNGLDNNGNPVSSGVYIISLDTGKFRQMRKMVLLK